MRGDEDRFSSAEELAIPDYIVGTQLGTTNELTSQEVFGDAHIKSYDHPAAVQALINGEVDAVEIDRPAGLAFTVTQGNLRVLDEKLPAARLGVRFPAWLRPHRPHQSGKGASRSDRALGSDLRALVRKARPARPGGAQLPSRQENAYAPYNYLDNDGKGIGWDYDTFHDICRLLNCVPEFQQMAWDGMLLAVSQGQVDVAADGITYTEERDETVDFSTLYQAYDETLLVRGDEDRFSSAEELKAIPDYIVGTQLGTTNELTSQEVFGDAHIGSYDQFPAAVQALINGEVDAVEIDRPAGLALLHRHAGQPARAGREASPPRGLAFAFPPGSDLIDPINQAKAAMEADGTWDDIYRTWFES
ncbi:MAG: transporter substrate-binding domain-containing protein [Anaerolineae bacterium]